MTTAAIAGVDLGGTKIAAALVDDENRVVSRSRIPTPPGVGPDGVIAALAEAVRQLDATPAAVGVGAPGPVRDGVVLQATNLPGWTTPVPLAQRLAADLGIPVVVENDVTAGTVGEWVAGAGRGAAFLLGVFLGTGVGGGLVLDGRPYHGAFGAAGEFGHMVVDRGGAVCGCGRRGCIEAYAGRACMERAVEVAIGAGRATRLDDLRREKGRDKLTSGVWAKALDAGDALAHDVLDAAVLALGAGIASAANLLDLDRVVIGGGMTEKLGQPLVDRIAAAAARNLFVLDRELDVLVASLADDAGVVGAAALARQAA